jgi:hypothetical protein
MIMSRRMRGARHAACMGEKRNAYGICRWESQKEIYH